jgi:hypothetical protein
MANFTQNDIGNDVLDVRDIIERFEEIEDSAADKDEAEQIQKILEELEGYGGDEQWRGSWYPITLIEDSYFTEYAMELLSDVGDLPAEIPHYIVIDEDATARNIQMDYSSIDIGDFTYWYR